MEKAKGGRDYQEHFKSSPTASRRETNLIFVWFQRRQPSLALPSFFVLPVLQRHHPAAAASQRSDMLPVQCSPTDFGLSATTFCDYPCLVGELALLIHIGSRLLLASVPGFMSCRKSSSSSYSLRWQLHTAAENIAHKFFSLSLSHLASSPAAEEGKTSCMVLSV